MTQPDIATRLTPALYAGCFRRSPPLSPPGTPSVEYDRALAAPALRALRDHMTDLAASGVLSHMAGTGGRGGQLIDAWRAMVDGKGDELDAEACSRFAFGRAMVMGMVGVEGAVEAGTSFEDACADAYAAFVATAAKGDLHGIEGTSEVCTTTGEHMAFTMAGWRPVAMTFDKAKGFAPAHDVERPALQHVEVGFPSGQVIVADCIRIPAFLEAIGWDRRDVGSEAGRIEATRGMAALGVASVWIGWGRSPMVATVDGTLVLGNLDGEYAGPEPANLGRVSTDMWNVMLADRETVVGLLSRGMPEEEARDALDRHLADAGRSARVVTVEPGTHHLYSAGDADRFGDLLSAADLDLAMPEAFRPILVVSPRPLAPEPGAPRP